MSLGRPVAEGRNTTMSTAEQTQSLNEFEEIARQIHMANLARLEAGTTGTPASELPSYTLPLSVQNARVDELPDEVVDGFTDRKNEDQKEVEGNPKDLEPLLEKRAENMTDPGKGMSEEEFERRARERRDKNIQDAIDRENKTYDQVITWGRTYPQYREGILGLYDKVSEFFSNLWEKIRSVINEMINKVIEWLGKVVQWFKDRVKDIVKWWEGLFG
jgi:hypothetical protein